MKFAICVLACTVMIQAQAHSPSAAVAYSCLSASSVAPSVKWQQFTTKVIQSQDDYREGFDATYFIIAEGKEIGYAKKGDREAIIFDRKLFPLERARFLNGFVYYPSELNPNMAEWGNVADASGRFLCVSFPLSELAQSGSFQKFRSAYLLSIERGRPQSLYFVSGNIELFKQPSGPLHIGALFGGVRAGLLKTGWKPVRVHDPDYESSGTERLLTGRRIYEVEGCSTDMGSLCIFYYRKGRRCLRVNTVGEQVGMMRVTSWDDSCPGPKGD
jgi:hypothetical protein